MVIHTMGPSGISDGGQSMIKLHEKSETGKHEEERDTYAWKALDSLTLPALCTRLLAVGAFCPLRPKFIRGWW